MRISSILSVAVLLFTSLAHSDGTCPAPTPRPAAGTQYRDANGVTWTRHILSEGRRNERTLLLVIDEPLNANLLPKVITRKSFTSPLALARAKREAAAMAPMSHAMDLTPTANPVWPIDRQWTEQDEIEYDKWIAKIDSEDFLVGGGVEVDCADYAIALRWIYAHDHHLPAGDYLTAGKGLFGNWQSTDAWDKLPTDPDWKKDARFKAALRYVLNSSFTHTIYQDLYPVAITPEYVSPGTIYLTLEAESGHTRTLINVGPNAACTNSPECMLIIWGNEPADERGYITEFVPYWLSAKDGGFMRFRWPELTASGWQLRDPKAMRGYSEEQYSWGSVEYITNISNRLHLWQSAEERMKVAGDNADRLLIQRMMVTEEGYVVCSLVPCTPSDSIYVNYSTPVRDHALQLAIQNFQNLMAEVDPSSQVLADFKHDHRYSIFAGAPFSAYEILSGDASQRFVSDPSADFFVRWGLGAPSDDGRIYALAEIARNVFWRSRMRLVMQAQNLCFPNGGDTPTCDPCDPKVKKLDTSRMDQGLRELRAQFLASYAKASRTARDKVDAFLQIRMNEWELCGADHKTVCSTYDFLLAPEDHWAAMTSNADSPLLKRMGF